MREVTDLSKLFKQTHSFQVHLVSELPKKYEKYENFIFWYKHLNDYLYLRGLEEGLHGNYLTGVANVAADLSWSERILGWLKQFYTPRNSIHESQGSLGKKNSKFFSAGLRAGLYGPATNKKNMKIGIELRDSTRNMQLLDQVTEQISESLENKIWETEVLIEIKSSALRLTSDRPTARDEITQIVSAKYAKLFAEIEPTVYFGLIQYENAKIYDYQNRKWIEPDAEVITRIQEARKLFEKDLLDLEIELTNLKANGQNTEKEIVKTALRMSLSTWAKRAKASELFSGF